MRTDKKRDLLKRRRWRIRKKVHGTVERQRMSVRMSNKNIYVQFIDDEAGHTLASVSSKAKSVENREKLSANVDSAKEIGKLAGEAAKAAASFSRFSTDLALLETEARVCPASSSMNCT